MLRAGLRKKLGIEGDEEEENDEDEQVGLGGHVVGTHMQKCGECNAHECQNVVRTEMPERGEEFGV